MTGVHMLVGLTRRGLSTPIHQTPRLRMSYLQQKQMFRKKIAPGVQGPRIHFHALSPTPSSFTLSSTGFFAGFSGFT